MLQLPSVTAGRAGEKIPSYDKTPFPNGKRGLGNANSFANPKSHGPRFRARVGTCQAGYMIPFRLPWRRWARPSATLHEIRACSEEPTWQNTKTDRAVCQEGFDRVGRTLLSAAVAVALGVVSERRTGVS